MDFTIDNKLARALMDNRVTHNFVTEVTLNILELKLDTTTPSL